MSDRKYMKSKFKSLKEILQKMNFILTTSHKKWGVVVVIMTVIGAGCETLGVSVILPLVQVMIAPQQLRENELAGPIIEFFRLDSDTALIWAIGAVVIGVYFLKNLFLLLLCFVRTKYACKVQRELASEMLESYMKRGYVFFLNVSTGELLRGINASINNTYSALNHLFKLFAEALTVGLICLYVMISDPVMAACIVILAGVCLTLVFLFFQNKIKKYREIYHASTAINNKVLLHTFHGIKEILVMQKQEYFLKQFKKGQIDQQRGRLGQSISAEAPTPAIEAVCVMGLIIAVCLKTINVENPETLVPQLAAFAVAAFRILPSLGRISNYFNQFMFAVPGINETYDNFKEARRQEASTVKQIGMQKVTSKTFQEKIKIDSVNWHYPNVEENVLEGIKFDIPKGQSVAFVGKSGAGKTTLADIILGLLEPQKGSVKIDDTQIADIGQDKDKLVGFVPQNVNLLDDTVRRNVAFGVEDKNIDDAMVWRALEQAQLKELIENSKDGLDTRIGERGIRFSGGQKQRFAIARALYSDPDILILDEATSALDTETETAVIEAIDNLQGQKTLIIIAHRITTIRNCDKIYEIRDGKAVERKYEELI